MSQTNGATLPEKMLATDITEQWDEYRTFTPVIIDDNEQRKGVLWKTYCELCGVCIRSTLRVRSADFVQSPISGRIINTATSSCYCDRL